MRAVRWFILFPLACLIGGCASAGGSATLTVPSGRYAAAFDAARGVLRDEGFTLNRVDARAGVITTHPKRTAGLATPWDSEQSTFGQEVDDFMNRQRRVVRVTFEPAARGGSQPKEPDDPWRDLSASTGPLTMRVHVEVLRQYQPGLNPQSSSLVRSTYAWDPALAQRGLLPSFSAPQYEDRALGGRIAGRIAQRIGDGGSAAEPNGHGAGDDGGAAGSGAG